MVYIDRMIKKFISQDNMNLVISFIIPLFISRLAEKLIMFSSDAQDP